MARIRQRFSIAPTRFSIARITAAVQLPGGQGLGVLDPSMPTPPLISGMVPVAFVPSAFPVSTLLQDKTLK
jgi:hypothetical protein